MQKTSLTAGKSAKMPKNKGSFTISLPSIPTKINLTQLMVAALVVMSFLIGSLYTKVQYLEKNGGSPVQAAAAQTAPQAVAPQQGNQAAVQAPAGKVKEVTNDERIRGNKNAKVTLVEYSDYECPFCKNFHPTMQNLMKTYGDKIRWVYRDYPLSFHQNAQKEAEAGRCIFELGGNDVFWNYTDKIFERTTSNGTGFALTDLGPLAAEVGVDQSAFQQCLDSGKYDAVIAQNIQDAVAAGAQGTPYAVIVDVNGQNNPVTGALPFENWTSVIDTLLAEQS